MMWFSEELTNNLSAMRGIEKDAYEAGYKAGLEAEIEIPVKKICARCGDEVDALHNVDTQNRERCD